MNLAVGDNGKKVSLITLPPEVLISIFSHVDEKDLYVLQQVSSYFACLINDEELWKNLFVSRIHTCYFPSFAQTNKYSIEYLERLHGLRQWKHNRAIKTKYVLSPSPRYEAQIERVIFDYPRCACYNDGIITLVQLNSSRKKDRLIYIPCTTPQGCSTMSFNINAAVFGRFDGRIFGKLLSNKSYLTPVTEFDSRHSSCVTAITTSISQDSLEDWCVSGSENGELIWWCETHKVKSLKISSKVILHVALYKNWTIAADSEKFYVIKDTEDVHIIPLPKTKSTDGTDVSLQVQFSKIDFGSMSLIIADTRHLFVISFNPDLDFGRSRSILIPETISNLEIDQATCKREQNKSLAGEDGCFLAVMTMENTIKLINVRAPGNTLKIENEIKFDEQVYTCQVSNLVLVCALSGQLQVHDAAGARLIKTVQKTDKYPQHLAISQGRMIIASGNLVHFLQYVSDASHLKKRSGSGGQRAHGNKWDRRVNAELAIYDEEESLRKERALETERLIETYGGDLSDDELQLRIALLESESSHVSNSAHQTEQSGEEVDENFERAIEESRLAQENQQFVESFADEDDEDFIRALEQSRADQEQNSQRIRRSTPLTDVNSTRSQDQATATNDDDDDEALRLALALSLSEAN